MIEELYRALNDSRTWLSESIRGHRPPTTSLAGAVTPANKRPGKNWPHTTRSAPATRSGCSALVVVGPVRDVFVRYGVSAAAAG
jgi:hypothetical protein